MYKGNTIGCPQSHLGHSNTTRPAAFIGQRIIEQVLTFSTFLAALRPIWKTAASQESTIRSIRAKIGRCGKSMTGLAVYSRLRRSRNTRKCLDTSGPHLALCRYFLQQITYTFRNDDSLTFHLPAGIKLQNGGLYGPHSRNGPWSKYST